MILWWLACVPKNVALSGIDSEQIETVLSTHTQRAGSVGTKHFDCPHLQDSVTALVDAPSPEALELAKPTGVPPAGPILRPRCSAIKTVRLITPRPVWSTSSIRGL